MHCNIDGSYIELTASYLDPSVLIKMSSEVIEKLDGVSADDSGDSNSSIANNNNEGGSKGVSALHDLIAGGVAGSMSVIVGRKFFYYILLSKVSYAIYVHIICALLCF